MKETLTDTSNNATWRLAHARMYATQCLHDEAQAIEDLISQLDENFDRAVELIYHCRGKVIVTGVGKSGNVGSKIAATMSSTGTPARAALPTTGCFTSRRS